MDLIKAIVLNSIYEPGDHIKDGKVWPPGKALTMVGQKRLDNVENLVNKVLENNIEGDLIEAGAWKGGVTILMKAILDVNQVKSRRVFVADSFEGIPKPDLEKYPEDEPHKDAHHMEILNENSEEEVREYFKSLDLLDSNVVFLKGWFKDTLPQINTKKLALIRVDGDLYESTMDALKYLYDLLTPGGYVIIDDYYSWIGCQKAVEDFRQKHKIKSRLIKVDWTSVYWQK